MEVLLCTVVAVVFVVYGDGGGFVVYDGGGVAVYDGGGVAVYGGNGDVKI